LVLNKLIINFKNKKIMKNLGIVQSFMALFNLEEEGKVISFYQKVEKALLKEQKVVEFNYEQEKFILENQISNLEDSIEDAKEEFENSFVRITIEDINTKSSQEDYVDKYLGYIRNKELDLKRLTDELADAKTNLKDLLSNRDEKLATLQTRLDKLNDGIDIKSVAKKKK